MTIVILVDVVFSEFLAVNGEGGLAQSNCCHDFHRAQNVERSNERKRLRP